MVTVNKLKGAIVEKGFSVEKLASAIGMDKSTFYRKLSTSGELFLIKEADLISKQLGLNKDEVNAIFFSQFVA